MRFNEPFRSVTKRIIEYQRGINFGAYVRKVLAIVSQRNGCPAYRVEQEENLEEAGRDLKIVGLNAIAD